jgi:hypothetical protein
MTRVVLAACQKATEVAVIDFTNPDAPTVKLVKPELHGTGYTVALAGSLGVIGSYAGTIGMQTINVSNPAAPAFGVPIPLRIPGVGAIAIDSTHSHVAVGEISGGGVKLFDIQSGAQPIAASTTISPITSIAFYGPERVAVSGHESQVWLIDFSGPSVKIAHIAPSMGTDLAVACDPGAIAAGGLVAVGDHENATVKLYEASNPGNAKATMPSNGLPGTLSLGLSGERALCGAISGEHAAAADFANGKADPFLAGAGSGAVVSREGFEGVCGGATSPEIALFELTTTPPGPWGLPVDSLLPSIQSIGLGTF